MDPAAAVGNGITAPEGQRRYVRIIDRNGDPISYTRLKYPEVAKELDLSDEQREQVTRIIAEMEAGLTRARDSERTGVRAKAEVALFHVLEPDQVDYWAKNPPEPMVKIIVRYQPWNDVLEMVARQAGLSLMVADTLPTGTFNYTDDREYTATEAINLLNGFLFTQGFTLVRNQQMLVVVNLASGTLPTGLVPKITLNALDPAELNEQRYGSNEYVSVLVPLERRDVNQSINEITPFIGAFGTVAPLQSGGIMFFR